jgi:hypothetical protein
MSRVRLAVTLALGLLLPGLLLLGFAGVDVDTPLRAAERLALDPARLVSRDARLEPRGDTLQVSGADANGISLLMQSVEPFEAGQYRHFSLALGEMPPVLRAMLVWRVDGELRVMPVPGLFHGGATIDLARVAGWQGQIDAIGIALLPTDYLAAELTTQRRFVFERGSLASDSMGGALRALITQWTAYRPWNGRSNNTAGFELSATPGPSLQAFVAGLLAISLLLVSILGGREGLRRSGVLLLVLALGVLAVRQAAQLVLRAQVASEAASIAADHPHRPLAAQPQLGHEALLLAAQLDATPPARLLLWSEDRFMREYPTWLLRRFNAASLHTPAQISQLGDALPGSVLVLAGAGGWGYDEATSRLTLHELSLPATRLLQGSTLQAYRLRGSDQ